ncbi:hypothetical protein [Pseudomonas sp. CFII64]|uniref:hypothetical protein n=1 Tax=Pseudomonas sp. CFII64 TaxID=911242 RepID=UPI000A02E581|nr:hypothetical protein [Pseudomonas sp. CFII64]
MKIKFNNPAKVPARPERPFPKTEILWGSQDGGSSRFPDGMEAVSLRRFSGDPTPLKAFGRAVSEAVERVWIVDEYFLMPDNKIPPKTRINKILEWLHVDLVASDIRILTKPHQEIDSDMISEFQKRADEINKRPARKLKQCCIDVRTHLKDRFDYVHDRFAVVDDELWHFGGTAGGFHAKVSAASRGWRASDHGAIEFFELAWRVEGGKC